MNSNSYYIGKLGIVSETKKGYVRVNFIEDEIVSDWLPVGVRKSMNQKESWPLEINEHVFCMMDEHCEHGVVLCAIHNETDVPDSGESAGKFRKKFSDGTILEYDVNTHKLKADVKGDVDIISSTNLSAKSTVKATVESASVEIEAAVIALKGNVAITGTATVSGTITAAGIATVGGGAVTSSGDISTTGDVIAGGKSLKNHTHGGIQPGGGTTSPPL